MNSTTAPLTTMRGRLGCALSMLIAASCASPSSSTIDVDHSFASTAARRTPTQCVGDCYWVLYSGAISNCHDADDHYCETIVKRYAPGSDVRRTYIKEFQHSTTGYTAQGLFLRYDRFIASAAELESPGLALDFFDATSSDSDTPFDHFSLSVDQDVLRKSFEQKRNLPILTTTSELPDKTGSHPYVYYIDVTVIPAQFNRAYQLILTSADLSACSDTRIGGSCDTYFRWSASEWHWKGTQPRQTAVEVYLQQPSDCRDNDLPWSSCWRSSQIQHGDRVATYNEPIVVLSDSDLKVIEAGNNFSIRFAPYDRDTGLLSGNDDQLGTCTLTLDASTLQQLPTGYTIPTCGDVKNVTFQLIPITPATSGRL